MNNTYKTNKTDWRRLGRSILFVALLLGASLPAMAADYVFLYNSGGTFHILSNTSNTITDVTTFSYTNCVWSGTSGSTFSNQGRYLYWTNNNAVWTANTSGDNLTINNNKIYNYYNGYYIYIRYNNNQWVSSNTDSQNEVVYQISTQTDNSLSTPTIASDDFVFTDLNSHIYSASATYSYKLYKLAGANTYYVVEGGTPSSSTTVPTTTDGITYVWSLADGTTDNGHVRINPSTGDVTYYNAYTDANHTVGIKVTATHSASGLSQTSSTKNITVNKLTAVNPTGITATDITVSQGNTITATNYTTTATLSAGQYPYSHVTATSDATDIATVANVGDGFTITGVAVGSATITIKAYNIGNSVVACSTTFTVTVTEPETGISGSIVILNDYEDHSWAYYSDPDCPVRSLNPANVKISYYGNGTGNMTNNSENGAEPSSFSLNATGVQVGPNDAANTFVYYKTLERANADGTGNLSYTTIPNPFQVRPTNGSGSGSASTTRTVYVSGRSRGGANNNTYKIQVTYYDADNVQRTWSDNSNNNVNTTITAKVGTTLTVTAIGRSGTNNNRVYSTITAQYDDNSGSTIATATTASGNYTTGVSASGTIEEEVVIDNTVMRGFYAWRIKSLSTGLTIVGHSVGDTVRAESPIQFQTTNEYGNTVEFVALWAQAKVQSGSSDISSPYASTVTGARERNFHVVNAETTAASFQKSYPCTVIGHLPGSTTLNATRNVTGGFTGAADTKFEDVNITGATSSTWNANNHDLIVGRGCSGTVNYVRGISGAVNPMNYKIRLESGTYQYISFTSGYEQTNGTASSDNITCGGTSNYIEGVLGCDYDRAAGDNNKLENTGTIIMGVAVTFSNQDVTKKTFDLTVKSGKFFTYLGNNMGAAGAEQSLYMSIANISGLKAGERKLTVEGGVLASIAGGIDAGNQNSDNDVQGLIVRMRGGTVNGAIYGGAATSPASGNRTLIITGGTVKGWIGAGCNGVVAQNVTKGGQTYGKSYVYVGGNVHVGGSSAINGSDGGTVFAAGKGSGASDDTESGMMAYGTTLVIADDCDILNNVYGGGNFGFAQTSTNMYITGGHVHGNIFGGSNQNKGPNIDIIMKAGTINGGLYGGCNTSGDISGHINIDIYGTDPAPSANTYAVGQVFGGGNVAAYTGTPVVTVHNDSSCNISIGEVYGGGNQASVTGTNVTIEAGNIIGDVYGGGRQAPVGNGGTSVTVNGGTIRRVFGGNNISGTIAGGTAGKIAVSVNKTSSCPMKIGQVFGGGNQAGSQVGSITVGCTGDLITPLADGQRYGYDQEGIGAVYGGANNAAITGDITLNIVSGIVDSVFGGNNAGGAIDGDITVNINKNGSAPCANHWYVGYVFGGGNNATYSQKTADHPAVNVSAGLVTNHVFGGGNGSGATVTGNPTVTLSGTAQVGGNVFGGGNAAAVSGNTSVKLQN